MKNTNTYFHNCQVCHGTGREEIKDFDENGNLVITVQACSLCWAKRFLKNRTNNRMEKING